MHRNYQKLKVMTILGTRPEIIRLARIMPKLDEYFDHKIVYTQQSYDYELSKIFFEELELRDPDHILNVKANTIGQQIGNILSQTEEIMLKEKPDAILVLGDTNTSLAAITAKRLKILIFHMEAGNRCYDWDVPEEVNRALVDVISDYNLPYTHRGFQYLVQNGVHPSKIFITGSPLKEVYDFFARKIETSKVLTNLKLQKGKYFVVSAHREENVDDPERLSEIIDTLNEISKTFQLPIIVTTHPRTRKRLEALGKKTDKLINFHKPFGILEYIKLEKNAFCVLSDSGTIQEESSMLGFAGVQIRANLERPEAFDKGVIILSGFNKDAVLNAIEMTVAEKKKGEVVAVPEDYQDKNVSTKVSKLIMGLTSVRKYHRK